MEEQDWAADNPYDRHAYEAVVAFLAPFEEPSRDTAPATAIMCFGSRDLHVPITAAEIFHHGGAEMVVCTGGVELLDGRTEAEVFAELLIAQGVPGDRIVVERESAHTHDNVVLGMAALREHRPSPTGGESVVAVAWPFVVRRCVATFALRFPDVAVRSVPAFCRPGEPAPFTAVTARWAVDQLDRLGHYADRGQIARVRVPSTVEAAGAHLRSLLERHHAVRPAGRPRSEARLGGADGPGMHGVLEGVGEPG